MKNFNYWRKNSMRQKIFVLAVYLSCMTLPVFGQTCPQSFKVLTAGSQEIEGWKSINGQSIQLLSGLDIVTGELKSEPSDNVLLRPLDSKDGSVTWKFSDLAGKEVVWMLCTYQGTSARLARRVDPSTTECRVSKRNENKGSKGVSIQAVCRS